MRCGHRHVCAYSWLDVPGLTPRWIAEPYIPMGSAQRFTCNDCGAWLPLGPARDTPETEIEVRAAEIAAGEAAANTWEEFGWHMHKVHGSSLSDDRDVQAGYLAHCIATHEEER